MGALYKSAASVSFHGDDLDPSAITELLGAPSVAARKGDTWLTSRGSEKTARYGFWRVKVDRRKPGDLDGQICALLNPLSNDLGAWRDFAARYSGRVFCGLFLSEGNEGLTLQPETLLQVAERGLRLDLDIYGQELPD